MPLTVGGEFEIIILVLSDTFKVKDELPALHGGAAGLDQSRKETVSSVSSGGRKRSSPVGVQTQGGAGASRHPPHIRKGQSSSYWHPPPDLCKYLSLLLPSRDWTKLMRSVCCL